MKRIVIAVMLLGGCGQPEETPPQKAGIKFLGWEQPQTPAAPATFTHYQLYPVNASVAWRLNVETGAVHLCVVTKDDGQCLGLGVK